MTEANSIPSAPADSVAAEPLVDWLVYFLRCADGTLYCGVTNHLERRLLAHARGGVKYTRGRLPVDAVFIQAGFDRSGALRCEAAYKRLTRPQKEALIRRCS